MWWFLVGNKKAAAVEDAYTLTEDDPATVIGVLAKDTRIVAGQTTISLVAQPANGTLLISSTSDFSNCSLP